MSMELLQLGLFLIQSLAFQRWMRDVLSLDPQRSRVHRAMMQSMLHTNESEVSFAILEVFPTNLYKGRPENYVPDAQIVQLPTPPTMLSPAPSTSLGPCESVSTSQQVQLPQTSSEPATPRPCDDKSKTTTSSWAINLEEMSDEEILAREKRAIERSLMMNYGKLECKLQPFLPKG